MIVNIYSDGGARGNPGPAAAAFVAYDEQDEKIFDYGHYLGESTNNVAEYSALYMAMKWLRQYVKKEDIKITSVVFHLDSELVVKQINGLYKIKNENLKKLYDKIQKVKGDYDFKTSFRHIPRKQNSVADSLVNQTLDEQHVKVQETRNKKQGTKA